MMWRPGVDHGQKHELGGATFTGRLDIIGPITEGREPINMARTADVRLGADNGLKSDVAPCPKGPRGLNRSRGRHDGRQRG
jgi:hypothetical protein